MQDVTIGDRVQVVGPDGKLTYDDLYFFGHRAAKQSGTFLKLCLEYAPFSLHMQRHTILAKRLIGKRLVMH